MMKRLLMLAAFFAFASGAAFAAYPERPVTLIVPFAAGGPTDVVARIVGDHMSRTLGQQIVIENVTGAGGTTGTTRAAQAAPDGYTIMMGHMGTHGAAPAVYPNLKYDPLKDFAPIGLAAGTPILIVAKKDLPPKDLKEFVAYAKKNSDKLNEAHAGVGSQIVNLTPQIQAGSIKAYGIGTEKRSPALPDVPTTKEGGLPEFQVSAWNALFAPKGTPKEVVTKLNAALVKALDDETTRKRLLDLGAEIADKSGRTPEALEKLVSSEIARWNKVLKVAAK